MGGIRAKDWVGECDLWIGLGGMRAKVWVGRDKSYELDWEG